MLLFCRDKLFDLFCLPCTYALLFGFSVLCFGEKGIFLESEGGGVYSKLRMEGTPENINQRVEQCFKKAQRLHQKQLSRTYGYLGTRLIKFSTRMGCDLENCDPFLPLHPEANAHQRRQTSRTELNIAIE